MAAENSSKFDGQLYLELNPDVGDAVRAGIYRSALHHWIACGRAEGRRIRSLAPPFSGCIDEVEYLYANPDVERAVRLGAVSSGAQHWNDFGRFDDRFIRSDQRFPSPPDSPPDWDEHVYLVRNPDIANAVRAGMFESGWDHWTTYGAREGRYRGRNQPESAPRRKPFHAGINYFGLCSARSGLGTASQGHVAAIERAGFPVTVNDIASAALQPGSPSLLEPFQLPHVVNLISLNPDMLQLLWHRTGTSFMNGRYNIGLWVWEPSVRLSALGPRLLAARRNMGSQHFCCELSCECRAATDQACALCRGPPA